MKISFVDAPSLVGRLKNLFFGYTQLDLAMAYVKIGGLRVFLSALNESTLLKEKKPIRIVFGLSSLQGITHTLKKRNCVGDISLCPGLKSQRPRTQMGSSPFAVSAKSGLPVPIPKWVQDLTFAQCFRCRFLSIVLDHQVGEGRTGLIPKLVRVPFISHQSQIARLRYSHSVVLGSFL
jgi:hypothetical protein